MNNAATLSRANIFTGFHKSTAGKKHIFFDRPYLQLLLLPTILWLFCQITAGTLSSLTQNVPLVGTNLGYSLGAVLVAGFLLLANKLYFKGTVPTGITTRNLRRALIFAAPLMLLVIWNAIGSAISPANILVALLEGSIPGIIEEICFRNFTIAYAMKNTKRKSEILVIAILSSVLFGAYHLINLTAGAPLGDTLVQVCYAFAIGLVFAAIYLRTGNIIPAILIHTLFDAAGSLPTAFEFGTLMIHGTDVSGLIPAVILIPYALFLLRKSKLGGIRRRWNRRFAEAR